MGLLIVLILIIIAVFVVNVVFDRLIALAKEECHELFTSKVS